MLKILYVMLGGALGSLVRYSASGLVHRFYQGTFPLGTLTVNLIGSFLIGFLWGIWEARNLSPNMRNFIFVGILGGFTTFSSFSLETMNLFRTGEVKYALINVFGSNLLGLLLVFGGYFLSKALMNQA